MTKVMGEEIGKALGRLVSVECGRDGVCLGEFMRIKVGVDVNKPLQRGLKFRLPQQDGGNWLTSCYSTNVCLRIVAFVACLIMVIRSVGVTRVGRFMRSSPFIGYGCKQVNSCLDLVEEWPSRRALEVSGVCRLRSWNRRMRR